MRNSRLIPVFLGAAFGSVVMVSAAHATRDQISSPAMFARFPNYDAPAGAHPDQKSIGPTCTNNPEAMPAGRQSDCSTNQDLQHPSTGVYKVTVVNGAPLPAASSFPLDTGWALFVSPVGSNARCAETATTWSNNNLVSTITCVNPSGANVDSDFVWVYRTDSGNYNQANMYGLDFAYARVNKGSGNQVVASQTISFYGSVTSQRLATGQFRVTFANMNLASSAGFVEPTTGMNNVVVQRTCANDSSAECKRAVCVPAAWSFPTQSGSNTTIDVNCYLGSSAINVDFRVFIGNQAVTSQVSNLVDGHHYGWASVSGFGPSVTCKQTNEFTHRNQHESVASPTLPLKACRTGTGSYYVDFESHGGFYSRDQASGLATSRTAGAYCNVGDILCGGQQCGSPPPAPTVGVRCYDNTTGNLKNAIWNLSVTY